ncbi:MAG: copper resistance protein B [Nevskia sp.]|nr:copper resistance protein B [Nevskia sp.]
MTAHHSLIRQSAANLLCGFVLLASTSAFGQDEHSGMAGMSMQAPATPEASAPPAPSATSDMNGMDMGATGTTATTPPPAKGQGAMDMGSMQGGQAPPDARDPNAYADGYDYGSMPGMEQADRIMVNKLLVDQLEFVHSREGNGVAWDIHDSYGGDQQKLLVRTEGAVAKSSADFTTGAEALWWRGWTPFWGTVLGLRQEFGPGAHTQAAFGVEGLAPYWFDMEATAYVAEDGRLSARLKGGYDVLITNRLVLTPEAETNLFSRSDDKRGVGAGVANLELSLRLRYEFSRKFAPYIGVDWDRAVGGTVGRRLGEGTGEPVSNTQLVAGVRMLW